MSSIGSGHLSNGVRASILPSSILPIEEAIAHNDTISLSKQHDNKKRRGISLFSSWMSGSLSKDKQRDKDEEAKRAVDKEVHRDLQKDKSKDVPSSFISSIIYPNQLKISNKSSKKSNELSLTDANLNSTAVIMDSSTIEGDDALSPVASHVMQSVSKSIIKTPFSHKKISKDKKSVRKSVHTQGKGQYSV